MATPANLSHEHLLAALELRFDYQSARAVAGDLLAAAGVTKADAYDAAATAKIRAASEKVPRAAAALTAIGHGPAAPAPAHKSTPAPDATTVTEPASATAPVPEAPKHGPAASVADQAPAEDAPAEAGDKLKKA